MTIAQFIARCFCIRTKAHELHLRAASYASHIALEEFYEAFLEHTDRFAEVWMGLNAARIAKLPDADDDNEYDMTDPVAFVQAVLEFLDDAAAAVTDGDPTLSNIHADMREVTARSLYKLKFLK